MHNTYDKFTLLAWEIAKKSSNYLCSLLMGIEPIPFQFPQSCNLYQPVKYFPSDRKMGVPRKNPQLL